jgi:hypothetical protein
MVPLVMQLRMGLSQEIANAVESGIVNRNISVRKRKSFQLNNAKFIDKVFKFFQFKNAKLL